MSLVSNLAQALIQAAQAEGVDPQEYISKAMAGSTTDALSAKATTDNCDACDQHVIEVKPVPTKRSYKRVVPEGDIAKMDLGTIAMDSKGRWHELVELPIFTDKTRRSWKLLKDYKPPSEEEEIEYTEPVFFNPDYQSAERRALVDYSSSEDEEDEEHEEHVPVASEMPVAVDEMHNTDSDSSGSGKARKPYTSNKPETSAKSQEVGTPTARTESFGSSSSSPDFVALAISGAATSPALKLWRSPSRVPTEVNSRPLSKPVHHNDPDPETLAQMRQLLHNLGVPIPDNL